MARTSKAVMEERYDSILELMRQRGGSTTLKDIEDTLGLPHHVVYVAVSNLRKDGQVVKVPGKSRTQYWGLPEAVPKPEGVTNTEDTNTPEPEPQDIKQLAIDFARAVKVEPEPDVTEPEPVTPPRHENIPDFTAPKF